MTMSTYMNKWVAGIIIKYMLTSKQNQRIKIKINTGETSTKMDDMRKCLAKIDYNNMLRNKIAVECWNIYKY